MRDIRKVKKLDEKKFCDIYNKTDYGPKRITTVHEKCMVLSFFLIGNCDELFTGSGKKKMTFPTVHSIIIIAVQYS